MEEYSQNGTWMLCKLCTVFSWEATSTSRTSTSDVWDTMGSSVNRYHRKISEVRNGYEYILTVMDYFTKWTEAYPIRDHKATTVARVLLENCFTRLGMPEEVISDQGAEFEGELCTEPC